MNVIRSRKYCRVELYMKITVIGNGGREQSIRWKLEQEGHVLEEGADFVVIGPEVPIAQGMVEQLQNENKTVFAPSKLAGRLETSKVWSKQFMRRHNIPTANFNVYKRTEIAKVINETKLPFVVKEDGLCGGKGVAVCHTEIEQQNAKISYHKNTFGSNTDDVLIEQLVAGEEVSCFVLTDGDSYKILPYCQDHKRVLDGDRGPNTGGMGSYAPAPLVTEKLNKKIIEQVIEPTLSGMKQENNIYIGVLYIGLIILDDEINVIEYNVRFGDPECQTLMMLMKSELFPYLQACTNGTLFQLPDPVFYSGSSITICMCSEGYPGHSQDKSCEIFGLENDFGENVEIFHAGTTRGNKIYTNGGRVLNVTSRADTLLRAKKQAEDACEKISWEGCFYRKDIGHKAIPR